MVGYMFTRFGQISRPGLVHMHRTSLLRQVDYDQSHNYENKNIRAQYRAEWRCVWGVTPPDEMIKGPYLSDQSPDTGCERLLFQKLNSHITHEGAPFQRDSSDQSLL